MKKIFTLLAISMFAFAACSDDNDNPNPNPTPDPNNPTVHESYIDASTKKMWTYFSLQDNKVVGTGEESEASDAEWAKRTDWDFAVNRYSIRTNSGEATTAGAQGGVYTCAENVSFAGLKALPEGAEFMTDKKVTSQGMGGEVTMVKSEATVILFKKNPDGSSVMPPVYLKAPVYVFRAANGKNIYKVEFTQYKNEAGESGHVKFNHAELK